MDETLKFDGKACSIEGCGTNNPAVAAFMQATFALDNFGISFKEVAGVASQALSNGFGVGREGNSR